VNPHQIAVKSRGKLIGRERAVVDPPPSIIEKVSQLDADLRPVTSDVLVGLTKLASPRPSMVEHFPMKVATEPLTEDIDLALIASPSHSLQDILLLPVIQVALGDQVRRDQSASSSGSSGVWPSCSTKSIAIGRTSGPAVVRSFSVQPVCAVGRLPGVGPPGS